MALRNTHKSHLDQNSIQTTQAVATSSPRKTTRLTILATLAVSTIAISGLAAVPATASNSGAETTNASIIIPAGRSMTTKLGTVPSGVKSVDVTFFTSDVAARTQVEIAVGPENTKTYSFTVRPGTSAVKTVTVPVTTKADGTVTASSTVADVTLNLAVAGFERVVTSSPPSPEPTPAPTPTPTPAPTPTPTPAPTPTPTPAPTPTPTPAPEPEPFVTPLTSGMPNATNTGVPAGTVLRVVKGDINVTTPGTVLNGLDIRGLVKISAANVTIKNSIIRGRAMNGSGALINNMGDYSNLTVTDTELFPTVMSNNASGFYGSNLTATRLNIHNVIDGIHITGSNVTVQKSWIHDHAHFDKDPNHNGTPSHDDAIQVQEGNNITINGNRLTGSYSAAVQITQDRGKVSNVSFTNNYADGGHCTVNIAQKSYGPLQGVVIKDNKFGRDTDHANCAIIAPTTTNIDAARNFYTDGVAVAIRKG